MAELSRSVIDKILANIDVMDLRKGCNSLGMFWREIVTIFHSLLHVERIEVVGTRGRVYAEIRSPNGARIGPLDRSFVMDVPLSVVEIVKTIEMIVRTVPVSCRVVHCHAGDDSLVKVFDLEPVWGDRLCVTFDDLRFWGCERRSARSMLILGAIVDHLDLSERDLMAMWVPVWPCIVCRDGYRKIRSMKPREIDGGDCVITTTLRDTFWAVSRSMRVQSVARGIPWQR